MLHIIIRYNQICNEGGTIPTKCMDSPVLGAQAQMEVPNEEKLWTVNKRYAVSNFK